MTRLILPLLILTSCIQPTETNPADIKEFFSQLDVLQYKNAPGFHINGQPFIIDSIENAKESIFKAASKEPLFLKEDITYIKSQIVADGLKTWSVDYFTDTKVVSKAHIDSIERGNPHQLTPPYIKLSKPYFSKNKQYCLLYYDYFCGSLCAEMTLKLYKRVNGRWKVVKTYYEVVS